MIHTYQKIAEKSFERKLKKLKKTLGKYLKIYFAQEYANLKNDTNRIKNIIKEKLGVDLI